MEKLISSTFELPIISIIGDEIESLQILSKYNESLIINSRYLSYISSMNLEQTKYNEINNLILNSNDNKEKNKNYIRLKIKIIQ